MFQASATHLSCDTRPASAMSPAMRTASAPCASNQSSVLSSVDVLPSWTSSRFSAMTCMSEMTPNLSTGLPPALKLLERKNLQPPNAPNDAAPPMNHLRETSMPSPFMPF